MRIVLHGLVGWVTFPSLTEELHPGFIAGWNVCAKNAVNQILWIWNTFSSARVLGNSDGYHCRTFENNQGQGLWHTSKLEHYSFDNNN